MTIGGSKTIWQAEPQGGTIKLVLRIERPQSRSKVKQGMELAIMQQEEMLSFVVRLQRKQEP